MVTTVKSIDRDALKQLLDSGQPVTLVEALPEKYFRDWHLPGAVNIPHDQVRQLAPEKLTDKNAPIVVYCANTACQNSTIAAQTLAAIGYSNVADYVAGKQDWSEAGLPTESGRAAA